MENQRRPGGLEKFQVTDREECGLIISNEDGLMYIVRIPNRAKNPEDYLILQNDYDKVKAVLSPDEKIIGFFHTHLPHHECEPSDTDFDGAAKHPEMEHLIYQPSTKKFCWYGGLAEVTN